MKSIEERLLNLEKKMIQKDEYQPIKIVYVSQDTDEVEGVVMGAGLGRVAREYYREDGEPEQAFLSRVETAERGIEKNEPA